MTANAGDGEREAMVYVINTDELSAYHWDGYMRFYEIQTNDVANTDLGRIVLGASIWYLKKGTGTADIPAEYFADDELITFTAETHIGQWVTKEVKPHRYQQVWEDRFTVPAGKYYPRELDRAVLGGGVGLPANCKVKVVLRPSKTASPDLVIDEPVESITIGGVEYTPTALSVDGVEYVVLAATPNEPEPTNEDNP